MFICVYCVLCWASENLIVFLCLFVLWVLLVYGSFSVGPSLEYLVSFCVCVLALASQIATNLAEASLSLVLLCLVVAQLWPSAECTVLPMM